MFGLVGSMMFHDRSSFESEVILMVFQFPAHEDESKHNENKAISMPLTDFLLTFAVEHFQHGFSDSARSSLYYGYSKEAALYMADVLWDV